MCFNFAIFCIWYIDNNRQWYPSCTISYRASALFLWCANTHLVLFYIIYNVKTQNECWNALTSNHVPLYVCLHKCRKLMHTSKRDLSPKYRIILQYSLPSSCSARRRSLLLKCSAWANILYNGLKTWWLNKQFCISFL